MTGVPKDLYESESSGIGPDIGMEKEEVPLVPIMNGSENPATKDDSENSAAKDDNIHFACDRSSSHQDLLHDSKKQTLPVKAIVNLHDIPTVPITPHINDNPNLQCHICSIFLDVRLKWEYHVVACAGKSSQSIKHVTRAKTRILLGKTESEAKTTNSRSTKDQDQIEYEMYKDRMKLLDKTEKSDIYGYYGSEQAHSSQLDLRRQSVGGRTIEYDSTKTKSRPRKKNITRTRLRRLSVISNTSQLTSISQIWEKKTDIIKSYRYSTIPLNKFLSKTTQELRDDITECTNRQQTRSNCKTRRQSELELHFRSDSHEQELEELCSETQPSIVCPVCRIELTNGATLETHINHKHRPYECLFCYKSFLNLEKLEHHYVHYHKICDDKNDEDLIENCTRLPKTKIILRKPYLAPKTSKPPQSLFGFDGCDSDFEIESHTYNRPDYQGLRYGSPVTFFDKSHAQREALKFMNREVLQHSLKRLSEDVHLLPSFTRIFYSSRSSSNYR